MENLQKSLRETRRIRNLLKKKNSIFNIPNVLENLQKSLRETRRIRNL